MAKEQITPFLIQNIHLKKLIFIISGLLLILCIILTFKKKVVIFNY